MLCACCVDTQSPTERGSDIGEDPIAHRPLPIKSRRSEGSPAPFPTGVTNIHANSQTQKCAHSSNPLLSTAACQPGDNKTTRGANASLWRHTGKTFRLEARHGNLSLQKCDSHTDMHLQIILVSFVTLENSGYC